MTRLARRRVPLARLLVGLGAAVMMLAGPLGDVPPAWAETLDEYRARVAAALALVDAVPDGDDAARARALGAVERSLGNPEPVVLAGGQAVRPADPFLRAGLAQADLARVRQQLVALLDALDRGQAARPAPPDAQARLAAILARPEFRAAEPGPLERLLRPLREVWEGILRRIAYWLAGQEAGPPSGLWLGLALLIVLAVISVVGGAVGGTMVASARVAARVGPDAPRSTRARAEQLATAGDYRAAVHELYLATLQHLDERGLLRFRPSLTNREHLARGQVAPALADPLGALVEGYDRLWYSGTTVQAPEWQRFQTLADAAWSVR